MSSAASTKSAPGCASQDRCLAATGGNGGTWIKLTPTAAVSRGIVGPLLSSLALLSDIYWRSFRAAGGARGWIDRTESRAGSQLGWRPQGDSNPCYRRERAVS